jgi:hypothetical protein
MECVTMPRSRAGACVRLVVAVAARAAAIGAALAVVAVGCADRSHQANAGRLVDGSTPPALPEALGNVERHVVATRVRVRRASELGARGQACLRRFRPEFFIPRGTIVVERAGVLGASLTLRDGRRHVVLGCDRTDRPAGDDGPWCDRSVGRVYSGHLRDPRVDVLCRSRAGNRIGFAWVEPAVGTRWIGVRSGGRSELYEVAAGLPIRVTTTDVAVETSSATFDLREYDVHGKEVRRQRLRAGVAG